MTPDTLSTLTTCRFTNGVFDDDHGITAIQRGESVEFRLTVGPAEWHTTLQCPLTIGRVAAVVVEGLRDVKQRWLARVRG